MTGYLRAKDFNILLYYIVRPDVLADPRAFELLPPWLSGLESDPESTTGIIDNNNDNCNNKNENENNNNDSNSNSNKYGYKNCNNNDNNNDNSNDNSNDTKKWKSLEFLLELQKKDLIQFVPHVVLGGLKKPFMSIQLTEPRCFPPNAFTFSIWLKLEKDKIIYDGLSGWCIPLLSLSGSTSCFLEVHWEVDTRLIRLMVNKKGIVSVIRFLLPITLPVDLFDWNLLVLTVHAKKLLLRGFMKSAVCFFLNGLPCQPVGAHTIAIDIPSDTVEICVGRYLMDATTAQDEGTKEELNILSSSLKQPLWSFGPIILWEESLSSVQLSLIFLRGPTYTGIFQGESPLTDHLSSISCDLLRKCDLYGLHVEEYINDIGLKGLECVVDPPMEQLKSLVSSFDLPTLPPAMLAYSPESAIISYHQDITFNPSSSGIFSIGSYIETILPCNTSHNNNGSNNDLPKATIKDGIVSQPSSISHCVANYGGPNIFFPMLQSAKTEDQLIGSLKILRQSLLGDNGNLKYMQIKGYKIVGFILSKKKKNLINITIMNELFEFCVSYGKTNFSSYGKNNNSIHSRRNSLSTRSVSNSSINSNDDSNDNNNCRDTLLLVDTPALYYLLLNHQIWSIKRSNYAQKVISFLELLSLNSTHGNLNNQRLGVLGR